MDFELEDATDGRDVEGLFELLATRLIAASAAVPAAEVDCAIDGALFVPVDAAAIEQVWSFGNRCWGQYCCLHAYTKNYLD